MVSDLNNKSIDQSRIYFLFFFFFFFNSNNYNVDFRHVLWKISYKRQKKRYRNHAKLYYNITKVNRALWLISKAQPFARGCTPRNWAGAVKFRQIQQISSPDGKIHRWMHRKVEVEENTKLSFWRKKDVRSSDKFALDDLITVFLAAKIGWRKIKRAKI